MRLLGLLACQPLKSRDVRHDGLVLIPDDRVQDLNNLLVLSNHRGKIRGVLFHPLYTGWHPLFMRASDRNRTDSLRVTNALLHP